MSISNTSETAILSLIFTATTWANYAINATSSPQTNIAVGLHSADPADAGTMATSEAAYTSYLRLSQVRTAVGWTVSGGSVVPASALTFAAGTGGGETVTHFSTGKTGGGAADILFSGTVTPNIITGNGITPQLTTATTISID